MKILLVDADRSQRVLAVCSLVGRGHEIDQATTVVEAVSHLDAATFDLMVIDSLLADGQSGFLVAHCAGPKMPVFLRTNEDPEKLMREPGVPTNILAAFSKFDGFSEIVEHAELLCTMPLLRALSLSSASKGLHPSLGFYAA